MIVRLNEIFGAFMPSGQRKDGLRAALAAPGRRPRRDGAGDAGDAETARRRP